MAQAEHSAVAALHSAELDKVAEKQAEHDLKMEERRLAKTESELEHLQNQFLTEEELLEATRATRLATVQESLDQQLLSEEEALALRNKVQEDYDKKLKDMQSNSYLSLLNVAERYYTALGGRQSANATLAINLAKTMLDSEKRAKKNSDLVQAIADKKKTTTTSDTTKLNNKIKSATKRLSDIKELFADIKELEKSETTKAEIDTYLIEYVTQLEDNLVAVTGGE